MKRFLAGLVAVAAVALVACADTSFVPDVTTPPLAFSIGVHGSPAPVIANLQQAGFKWIRLTYYYQTLGDTMWTRMLDEQLTQLSAAGLSIDLVVHSTPVNDPNGDGIPHAVADLLRTHPGAIDAVELYNEENIGVDTWRPILPGTSDYERGRAYASRYTAMRDTVRALYPLLQVPVVTGGTAGGPAPFLQGIKDAGVTPDIVAVHAYGFPPHVQLDQVVREARSVFPTTPVWATEVGSEGGRTDSTTFILDVHGVFAWMLTHPDVRVFWYVAWGDEESSVWDQTTFAPRPGTSELLHAGPFR